MYCPSLFREDRLEVQHAFIRSHPLGLLISFGSSGLIANLLPFELKTGDSERGVLQAHIARANPQSREIDDQEVLVVFRGPDAYVSPSLYTTKKETGKVVSTWNYAMVQARGKAKLRDHSDWLIDQLNALTTAREAARAEPWSVADAPRDYIEITHREAPHGQSVDRSLPGPRSDPPETPHPQRRRRPLRSEALHPARRNAMKRAELHRNVPLARARQ